MVQSGEFMVSSWFLLPSGKHTTNYGKIHHFSWENSLFLWPFSIAMLNSQRVVCEVGEFVIPRTLSGLRLGMTEPKKENAENANGEWINVGKAIISNPYVDGLYHPQKW